MEQDTETLKELIDEYKSCAVIGLDMQVDVTFREKQCRALEHLIKAYKELKEEYSNEQKSELLAYKELQEKNLELEKEKNKYLINLTDEQYRKLIDIIRKDINKEWTSKIEEKIEELKLSLKDDCIALHEFQRLAKIDVLQELLEKRK